MHWSEYDHVLINDDLDRTFAALREILAAGRRKNTARADLKAFVEKLLAELRQLAV